MIVALSKGTPFDSAMFELNNNRESQITARIAIQTHVAA